MARLLPASFDQGVRFACRCSSRCCRLRDDYTHVYVAIEDRRRLAAHLGMPTSAFTRSFCERTPEGTQLKSNGDACIFLREGRCSVYEARPLQCRTWPFWPENMTPRAWKEVAAFCPGVGRGPLIPVARIARTVREQETADARVD